MLTWAGGGAYFTDQGWAQEAGSPSALKEPPRSIHPYPHKVVWGEGFLRFSKQAKLTVGEGSNPEVIAMMEDLWGRFTAGAVRLETVRDPKLGPTDFRIGEGAEAPAIEGNTSYSIKVDAKGAAARAKDEDGLRFAWYTFLQLLAATGSATDLSFSAPQVEIQDWVEMKFRGIHLCIFRETPYHMIERAIRLAAFMKFSHVVLEFWGMLRLDALAELAWPEAWTKDEAGKLVTIARSMGLEVVPMFNSWGHATSSRIKYGRHVVLDQNPSLAPLFEPDGWTWCLSNPDTLALLEKVHDELIEFSGPGQYFHIGCDEAYSHGTCDQCREKNRTDLLANHINHLTETLEKRGRRPLMWGDALLESGKWPNGFAANGSSSIPTHLAIDKISKKVVITDWHYGATGEVPTLAHFKEHGFETIACPWKSSANIRALAKGAFANGSDGLLLTTWHHLVECMPLMHYTAACVWSKDQYGLSLHQAGGSLSRAATATLLRKLVPAEGDFDRAGWNPFELPAETD